MNALLWVVQALLALLCSAGGAFKLTSAAALASQFPMLPATGWRVLGVVEVAGAILLIVPAATRWMPALTPIAAVVIALEALGLAAVYGRSSLQLVAANPLVWSVAIVVLAALVAYGRFALRPVV